MKTVTYEMLMENNACYDPKVIGMPEDYEGTPLEFIREYRSKVRQPSDIVWVLTRPNVLNESPLREFALFCGNQVRHLMKDERSIKALDITRAYLDGQATREELNRAAAAADDAYAAAAYSAYAAAAYSAYAAAAYSAYAAAAADDAYAYAYAAAAADDAYAAAAYSATQAALLTQQIDKLIEVLEEEK
jgi:hypothetical protein